MSDANDLAVEFNVIELSMLNKQLFLPLSSLSSFTCHTILYPLVLVRTRLQVQEGSQVYRGLAHAAKCILKEEGLSGLYSGYLTKCFQLVSGLAYVTTYEGVRSFTANNTNLTSSQRSFIGGATASTVAQTFMVPVDVISQHLMLQSRASVKHYNSTSNDARISMIRSLSPVTLQDQEINSSWRRFCGVIKYISKNHGFRGFYHGYCASLCTFVPSSGFWWFFYDKICSILSNYSVKQDVNVPRFAVQLFSAPLAGISSAILINPLDCIRVRMQISNRSFREALNILWQTEGSNFIFKGLSARIAQSALFSFWLILFYEPVKIYCLKEEYKDSFKLL